jgi:hypothetical protein
LRISSTDETLKEEKQQKNAIKGVVKSGWINKRSEHIHISPLIKVQTVQSLELISTSHPHPSSFFSLYSTSNVKCHVPAVATDDPEAAAHIIIHSTISSGSGRHAETNQQKCALY